MLLKSGTFFISIYLVPTLLRLCENKDRLVKISNENLNETGLR